MIIYPKLPDWEARLHDFMYQAIKAPGDQVLDWVTRTCGSWVADAVHAQTDHDFYAPLRSGDSIMSVVRLLHIAGFKTMEEYVAAQLPRVELVFARRGDVLLVPAQYGQSNFEGTSLDKIGLSSCVALADPPFYWCISSEGLVKGNMYTEEQGMAPLAAYRVGLL